MRCAPCSLASAVVAVALVHGQVALVHGQSTVTPGARSREASWPSMRTVNQVPRLVQAGKIVQADTNEVGFRINVELLRFNLLTALECHL